MGKVLRAVALASSVALAAGAGGALAQEDEAVVVGAAETASTEELTEAILAEVLQGLALPDSGGLEIDVPAASSGLIVENVPTIIDSGGTVDDDSAAGDINVGGSSGGEITVGGMGGGITVGGGAVPAPAPEVPAPAPAPEAAAAPTSGY